MNQHSIRDVALLRRSKVFAFRSLYENVPAWVKRGICPTDIDHVVEMSGKFLWFELKSADDTPDVTSFAWRSSGQGKAYRSLLTLLGYRAMLVYGTHGPLVDGEAISIPEAVDQFQVLWTHANSWQHTAWFSGQHLASFCERWAEHEFDNEGKSRAWRNELLKATES